MFEKRLMPRYIKDEATALLVRDLAALRGISKQAAVKLAVQAELRRAAEAEPLHDRIARFWRDHPLPPATGQAPDKVFFDALR